MKHALIAIAAIASLPVTAKADIRSNCFNEWKNNYKMVEYCIQTQTQALSSLQNTPSSPIKSRCLGEWGENYRMVNYCIERQSGAASRLGVMGEYSKGQSSTPAGIKEQKGQQGCRNFIIANGVKHCM